MSSPVTSMIVVESSVAVLFGKSVVVISSFSVTLGVTAFRVPLSIGLCVVVAVSVVVAVAIVDSFVGVVEMERVVNNLSVQRKKINNKTIK